MVVIQLFLGTRQRRSEARPHLDQSEYRTRQVRLCPSQSREIGSDTALAMFRFVYHKSITTYNWLVDATKNRREKCQISCKNTCKSIEAVSRTIRRTMLRNREGSRVSKLMLEQNLFEHSQREGLDNQFCYVLPGNRSF